MGNDGPRKRLAQTDDSRYLLIEIIVKRVLPVVESSHNPKLLEHVHPHSLHKGIVDVTHPVVRTCLAARGKSVARISLTETSSV